MIEKDSLKFKELEHVLIEKVEQLFRDMLWREFVRECGATLDRADESAMMPTADSFGGCSRMA